jgi:hypothetical protein
MFCHARGAGLREALHDTQPDTTVLTTLQFPKVARSDQFELGMQLVGDSRRHHGHYRLLPCLKPWACAAATSQLHVVAAADAMTALPLQDWRTHCIQPPDQQQVCRGYGPFRHP